MSDTNELVDLPPEYCHYADEGCALEQSCLGCRFDVCVYDGKRGKQRALIILRDREIRRQYRKGKREHELASKFALSERTVSRIVSKKQSGKKGQNPISEANSDCHSEAVPLGTLKNP